MRAVKDERFRQLSKILLSTTGQTNWTHCFATDLGDVQSKGFWRTKDTSALHHFQSFPTLFDIRKIPSSLPNGETSTLSGLRLLSSLSKPAALTAADFTSFHISLFVDPLVSLLWNKLKCSSTCSAKMVVSVTEVSFSRFACFHFSGMVTALRNFSVYKTIIMGCFGA